MEGFPRWCSGKESVCQGRRHRRCRLHPWERGGEIPWSRKWHPTPVYLPEKFHGQRSLVGYRLWSCKEPNVTEHTHTLTHTHTHTRKMEVYLLSYNYSMVGRHIELLSGYANIFRWLIWVPNTAFPVLASPA